MENLSQPSQEQKTTVNESARKTYIIWYILGGIGILCVGMGVVLALFLFTQESGQQNNQIISGEFIIDDENGAHSQYRAHFQYRTYTNVEYGFSFLYPNTWMLEKEGGEEVFYNNKKRVASITCPIREVGYEAWNITKQERENTELWHLEGGQKDLDDFSLVLIKRDNWRDTCEILIRWEDDINKKTVEDIYESIQVSEISDSSPNVIRKGNWGVTFQKHNDWSVVSSMSDYVILNDNNQDDTIRIDYVTGPITTKDAKFGDRTFYYDTQQEKWMRTGQYSETQGTQEPAWVEAEFFTNQNGLKIFTGTTRWLTYIIPLKEGEQEEALVLNITGTGDTQALKDVVKTIERI